MDAIKANEKLKEFFYNASKKFYDASQNIKYKMN